MQVIIDQNPSRLPSSANNAVAASPTQVDGRTFRMTFWTRREEGGMPPRFLGMERFV